MDQLRMSRKPRIKFIVNEVLQDGLEARGYGWNESGQTQKDRGTRKESLLNRPKHRSVNQVL